MELYAPLAVPGFDSRQTRLFLSMPLLAQQEEATVETALIRRRTLLATFAVFLLLAALGTRLARAFTRPIMEIVAGTQRIAGGAAALGVKSSVLELAALAEAIDRMARKIGAAGKTVRNTIAGSYLEELARHAIGQENPAGLIEIDHAGGDVLDDALHQPLLAQQLVAALADLARHAIDRLGKRRELEHRGLDAERASSSR